MTKEQLRKELEDCWDAALERVEFNSGKYTKFGNAVPITRDEYITTRLAALDDGELTRMCMAASEKSLAKDWVDDGQEGKGLVQWEYIVKVGTDDWKIDEMGNEGWELCAITGHWYYFKRPKTTKQ